MKDLFVTYEMALLLKEKGFNESCLQFFKEIKGEMYLSDNDGENSIGLKITSPFYNFDGFPLCDTQIVSAPIYQQVLDWLDDKHKTRIIFSTCKTSGKYRYDIVQFIDDKWTGDYNLISFFDRIEMRNKAIQEALKLI